MVHSIFEIGPGYAIIRTWVYEDEEGCSISIHCMDRLFRWYDSGNGGNEDGSERDYPLSFVHGSSIHLLYCSLSDASVVFVWISGCEVEYIKNYVFCFVYADRNSTGMLCESSNCKNVSKDFMTKICTCLCVNLMSYHYVLYSRPCTQSDFRK